MSTSSQQEKRGRETAGLPQGGKTPLGFLFFLKTCVLCASFDPTFPFWGKKIYSLLSDGMFILQLKPPHNQGVSLRNMSSGNKSNLLSKLKLLPEEVRESEQTHLDVQDANADELKLNCKKRLRNRCMTQCTIEFTYDAVLDQPYLSVPKTSEFESGPRVVKMVLNTQCYLYLWLTM